MKCEVWGHSHTDKNCPKYGKARDSDQPVLQVRALSEKFSISDCSLSRLTPTS